MFNKFRWSQINRQLKKATNLRFVRFCTKRSLHAVR